MFYNCSNLKKVKCLATDITANNCTQEWLSGVPNYDSNHGTFYKNPNMPIKGDDPDRPDYGWVKGTGGIPSKWDVSNAPTS